MCGTSLSSSNRRRRAERRWRWFVGHAAGAGSPPLPQVAFLKTEAPVGGRQLSGALVQLEVSGDQVISGPARAFWCSDASGAGAKRKLLVKSSFYWRLSSAW